jgi:hypothetical protein
MVAWHRVTGRHGKHQKEATDMSDTRSAEAGAITGGCLCGKVRYTATGEPAFSGLCHCRNCQRNTGSAFETVVAFPAASVSVQGELKTYVDTGDSGQSVRRRFCPNCGSGVLAEVDVMPGVAVLLAGTLDDPAGFKPTVDVYWSSAQPWVVAGGERTQFAKMPS